LDIAIAVPLGPAGGPEPRLGGIEGLSLSALGARPSLAP